MVYPGGRVNRYPQWIAAVGDILQAMALLKPYGLEADPQPTLEWLLRGQEPSGGFRTAHRFASQIAQREPGGLPEFRDLLPVVGWSSMAFRYLTDLWPDGAEETDAAVERFEAPCVFRGRELTFVETEILIELRDGVEPLYRWRKGTPWAEVCAPELLWK